MLNGAKQAFLVVFLGFRVLSKPFSCCFFLLASIVGNIMIGCTGGRSFCLWFLFLVLFGPLYFGQYQSTSWLSTCWKRIT